MIYLRQNKYALTPYFEGSYYIINDENDLFLKQNGIWNENMIDENGVWKYFSTITEAIECALKYNITINIIDV